MACSYNCRLIKHVACSRQGVAGLLSCYFRKGHALDVSVFPGLKISVFAAFLLSPAIMRSVCFLVATLFIPWGLVWAKFDEFDDGDDIVEYDDNDFAEFEDVIEDPATESPQRVVTTEDDEEEATVELEGQDENLDFEDADAQVIKPGEGLACSLSFLV